MPPSSSARSFIDSCLLQLFNAKEDYMAGEAAGKLYWYDDAGKRQEVADTFQGIRTY